MVVATKTWSPDGNLVSLRSFLQQPGGGTLLSSSCHDAISGLRIPKEVHDPLQQGLPDPERSP